MLCVPMPSAGSDPEGTTSEARPSAPRAAVPSAVVPSENATVPLGLATPGAPVTKAVRVTTAPYDGAAGAAETAADEMLLPIVNCIEPLLAALLVSPE